MGHFEVTPAELHGAATTLRSVQGQLAGSGDAGIAGLSVGELGSAPLVEAVADFAHRAAALASAFESAVTATGQKADGAGDGYERTDDNAVPAVP